MDLPYLSSERRIKTRIKSLERHTAKPFEKFNKKLPDFDKLLALLIDICQTFHYVSDKPFFTSMKHLIGSIFGYSNKDQHTLYNLTKQTKNISLILTI